MVDVVTVPNLSEHLSSAATTAQLSARFAYAAAMKSINNLLLLGDGETWNRQTIDFGGLPAMVQTFLQVVAGAADIPVTRLLGQSPAGLSATGDSDTRNYYDMISSRQEIDLRPQLERLDRLILRSAGVDPAALTFEFRPLWQLDAAEKATVALSKAQATAAYAGLNLWPAEITAQLVQAQLVEDGIYPNAEAIFAEARAAGAGVAGASDVSEGDIPRSPIADLGYDPDQPRDLQGRWTSGGGNSGNFSSQLSSLALAGYGKLLDPTARQEPPEKPILLAGGSFFSKEEKKLEKEEEEDMGGSPPPVENLEEQPLQIDPLESKVPGGGAMSLPSTLSGSVVPGGPPLPSAAGQPGRAATEAPPEAFPKGSFSITDWTGYPTCLPKPDGPFRILTGDEYSAARDAADNANRAIHASDPSLAGVPIHEIQPVKFGGDLRDLLNKIPLTPSQHAILNIWWSRLQRNLNK